MSGLIRKCHVWVSGMSQQKAHANVGGFWGTTTRKPTSKFSSQPHPKMRRCLRPKISAAKDSQVPVGQAATCLQHTGNILDVNDSMVRTHGCRSLNFGNYVQVLVHDQRSTDANFAAGLWYKFNDRDHSTRTKAERV